MASRLNTPARPARRSFPVSAGAPGLTETLGTPSSRRSPTPDARGSVDRIKRDNAIRPWQFIPGEQGLTPSWANEHALVVYDLPPEESSGG